MAAARITYQLNDTEQLMAEVEWDAPSPDAADHCKVRANELFARALIDLMVITRTDAEASDE